MMLGLTASRASTFWQFQHLNRSRLLQMHVHLTHALPLYFAQLNHHIVTGSPLLKPLFTEVEILRFSQLSNLSSIHYVSMSLCLFVKFELFAHLHPHFDLDLDCIRQSIQTSGFYHLLIK